MSENKDKLSIDEQVKIIQRTLKDPRFFDDEQKIDAGIKNKPLKKEVNEND